TTDGTPIGTRILLAPSQVTLGSSSQGWSAYLRGRTYWSGGLLSASDGTPAGTGLLYDDSDPPSEIHATRVVRMGDAIYILGPGVGGYTLRRVGPFELFLDGFE